MTPSSDAGRPGSPGSGADLWRFGAAATPETGPRPPAGRWSPAARSGRDDAVKNKETELLEV